MAAATATIQWEASVRSVDGHEGTHGPIRVRFPCGAGNQGKWEQVTLTASAFTALSPPSGAKAVALLLGSATGLTIKGITGDTGIALTPAAAPIGLDAFFPLGSAPSIGITSANTSNQTIQLWWF